MSGPRASDLHLSFHHKRHRLHGGIKTREIIGENQRYLQPFAGFVYLSCLANTAEKIHKILKPFPLKALNAKVLRFFDLNSLNSHLDWSLI